MIILDTNVVSELLRARRDATVVAWISARPPRAFHTTSVTQAEMLLGAALLPPGKRRDGLQLSIGNLFAQDFESRVLPFDHSAAPAYAAVTAARRAAGRPISILDAQIAAICVATRAQLATHNIADFEGCGIDLINPWAA